MQNIKLSHAEQQRYLDRLMHWSELIEPLAQCPLESLQRVGNIVSFFVDTSRGPQPLLPGMPSHAQVFTDRIVAEADAITTYLVRLHKERFGCAIRGATNDRYHRPDVHVVGSEIEFNVPVSFVRKALAIYGTEH